MVAKKKSTAKKKVIAKKKVVTKKKVAAAPAVPVIKAITTKQTKTQIIADIAEKTGLSKKDVGAVFSALSDSVTAHIKRRGSGEFTIPEVGVKIRKVKKPATKARKGRNPFTGEEIMIKAKPASNTVRMSALKSLKDKVNL